MLKPSEFSVGHLEDAEPLTLLLPSTSYNQRALSFALDGKKMALFLDGPKDVQYYITECEYAEGMRGMLIPNVGIELDPESICDIDGQHPRRGSLVRYADMLSVQAAFLGNNMSHFGGPRALLSGLPKCDVSQRACFSKWQIVLGQGDDKRVLHTVDVTDPKSD